MEEVRQASSSKTSSQTPPPPPVEEDNEGANAAGASGNVSDDSEDEVADFRMLLPQLLADKNAKTSGHGAASIPKRGEKDFEPTGFKGQERKLEESRRAMEMVISQQRRTGSKVLSRATWYPHLNRAVVESHQGTTIASLGVTTRAPVVVASAEEITPGTLDVLGPNNQVGVWKAGVFYPRYHAQLELFPEEVLYLIERGTLDCRTPIQLADSDEKVHMPLSLQHAFSLMLGRDGCTRERYQTYSYLKRLGYYVQRAQTADDLRKKAAEAAKKRAEQEADYEIATPSGSASGTARPAGIIADPKRPLRLVTIWDLLMYVPRRIAQLVASGFARLLAFLQSRLPARRTPQQSTTSVGLQPGRGLLGIGGKQWDNYDDVYSALRIIPSGHGSGRHNVAAPPASPFTPFFYAWRPATQFKKTDPPLPEYRIAVVSARETSLPKLHEFTEMFEAVPMPIVPAADGEEESEEQKRAAEQKKRNDESYGRGFAAKKKMADVRAAREKAKRAKEGGQVEGVDDEDGAATASTSTSTSLPGRVASRIRTSLARAWHIYLFVLLHLPPGCHSTALPPLPPRQPYRRPPQSGPRKPNPFPPLKSGRRDVILAIVDHGTSSLLRFGEAEFDKWRLMG